MVNEVLSLLNCPQSSILPSVTLDVLHDWMKARTADSQVLLAMMKQMGSYLTNPATLAKMIEWSLEAFFCDTALEDVEKEMDNNFKKQVQRVGGDAWELVLPLIDLCWEKKKVEEMLDFAVKEGFLLLLYLYLRKRRPLCQNLQDESNLISTILTWLKDTKYK